MAKRDESGLTTTDEVTPEMERELYARHVEINSLEDLVGSEKQRGTPIPALFNLFYRFIQNPSTVSIETMKRMVDTDDTVGSGVDFLTSAMAARIDDYTHPSKEITQWVNTKLKAVEGGWHNAIKDIASAAWAGYSVSEKVWGNDSDGFAPKRIVTLPPSSILFEADRTGQITEDGILQYQRNYNPLIGAGGIGFFGGALFGFTAPSSRPDAYAKFGDLPFPMRSPNIFSYLSIRIPKLKCIHYPFASAGRFGNPYGRSLLRRCYKYWVMKDAFLQMLSIALDRKGTPLTVAYVDPMMPMKDANSVRDDGKGPRGTRGSRIDPLKAVEKALANIHNDSVLIIPGKKDGPITLDTLTIEANAEVFISAIKLCDAAITRSLLIPALIFTNGDGTGSHALGQEHAKTWDKILDSFNEGLKAALIDQLIHEMIAYNFPESAWKKDGFGDFAKRQMTQDERDKEANMVQTAVTVGAIDMQELADLNKARGIFGFEPRDKPIPPRDPEMGGDEPDDFDDEPPPKKKPTKAKGKARRTRVAA